MPLKPRYRLWGPDWQPGTKPWSIGIIYLTVMFHAWRSSGDPEYLRQIERWHAGCGLDNLPSGGSGRSYRELYLPSLLMEIDPWRHRIWRAMTLGTFRNVRGSIQPDGTVLQSGRWGPGPYRSGRSAIYARGMVSAQRWFPEEPLAETAPPHPGSTGRSHISLYHAAGGRGDSGSGVESGDRADRPRLPDSLVVDLLGGMLLRVLVSLGGGFNGMEGPSDDMARVGKFAYNRIFGSAPPSVAEGTLPFEFPGSFFLPFEQLSAPPALRR